MTTLAELVLKADYRQTDRAGESLDRLTSSGEKAVGMAGRLAASLGVAFGVREIIQAAEAYTTISNRLSLVTDSSEQLAAAQQDVFSIAQKTRSPLRETAEVYQRLATNADQLGMTLGEVGDTTETINKLMVISGTSGQSAAAALTQLGQAFASGTLRGEELNSVMEQAPALAKAIADGMGVTVGQLRQLGQDGKITAETVVNALKNQADAVDQQFSKIAPPIDQAMTQAGNSLVNFVGKADKATGASSALASAISRISDALDNEALAYTTRLIGTWGASFSNAAERAKDLGGEMLPLKASAYSVAQSVLFISNAFVEMPANIKAAVSIAATHVADFVESVKNDAEAVKGYLAAAFTTGALDAPAAIEKTTKAYQARQKALEGAKDASIAAIFAQRDAEIAAGKSAADAALKGADSSLLNKGGKGGKGGGGGSAAAASEEELARQKQIQDEIAAMLQRQEDDKYRMMKEDSERNFQQWEDRIEFLRNRFTSESEVENLHYQQSLDDYAEYAKAFGISETSQQAMREQMAQDHADKLGKIAADAAAKDKTTLAYKLGAAQAYMNDLYTRTGAHSNKMTKLLQTVGAAQAFISTFVGAAQVLADPRLPFFAKFTAVAQTIATGMGLVNAIKGGGSAGGGGGGAASAPDTSGIVAQQAQPARAQVVDIRIQSQGMWRDEDVAELMSIMGERLKDGAKFGRVDFVRAI